jgi:hypothetical protein
MSERIPPGECIGITFLCVVVLLGVLALGMMKGCEVGKQQATDADANAAREAAERENAELRERYDKVLEKLLLEREGT